MKHTSLHACTQPIAFFFTADAPDILDNFPLFHPQLVQFLSFFAEHLILSGFDMQPTYNILNLPFAHHVFFDLIYSQNFRPYMTAGFIVT